VGKIKTEISEIIVQLNTLLVRNKDAEKGYHEAKDRVSNPELKSFMVSQAKQRATFSKELGETVRSLGGSPTTGASIGSEVHRAWLDLRTLITTNINPDRADKVIVVECKRGEQAAINDYMQVLEETNLAPPVRKLLQQQVDRITAAYQFLTHFNL